MDDVEENHLVLMNRLLKKASDLHKDSTRELSSNLVKTKSAYYNTLDKCQQLQKQNEDLRKKLQEYLACMQRCPYCSNQSSIIDKHTVKSSNENDSDMKISSSVLTPVVSAADDGCGDDDDDLDFGESLDSSNIGSYKLQSKQNKRSRNSQETSPEHKRARKLSPKQQTTRPSDSQLDLNFSQKFTQDSSMKNKASPGKRVLVPDTCVSDTPQKGGKNGLKFKTASKDLNKRPDDLDLDFDKLSNDHDLDLNFGENLSLLVVPETMGMDMDDFGMDDDDDDDIDDENGTQIDTNVSSMADDLDETVKPNCDFDMKEMNKKSEELTAGRKNSSDDENMSVKLSIPQGIKSLLMSPDKESAENTSNSNASEKCVNSKAQDAVLCKNSDDSDDDKIPCSHTFGKSKHHFRKNKKQTSHLDDDDEIILRRSPRKHKSSVFNSPSKLDQNSKTKRCLPIMIHPLTTSDSPKNKKSALLSAKSKNSVSLNKSKKNDAEDFVDCDETIAPENCPVDSTLKENLSMDCYTIVPLNGGKIDVKNQFQVKVAKNKSSKHNSKDLDPDCDFVKPSSSKSPESVESVLKSPSLLGGKAKTHSSFLGKVEGQGHPKNRSPSDTSRSNSSRDQMSSSVVSGEKMKSCDNDSAENSDWMSTKDKRVGRSCSQDSSSRSQQRSSVRSLQKKGKIKKSGSLYSFNFEPDVKVDVKNMHQTTLTQSFFSPKIKNDKKEKKVAKSVSPEAELDEIETDHVFKKPDIKCGKKLKAKHKSPVKSIPDDDSDFVTTTTTNDDDDVLIDITNDINNDNVDMNRSMDPDLDLSKWCNDPESLPSLDTDLENIEPEVDNLTMENSFDCRPKKPKNIIAHTAVVRKHDERQKLQGFGCKQCLEYYKSAGRSEDEIKNHMCQCSRHRAQYAPPDTPPHFWSIGFMDTQECNIHTDKKKEKEESTDIPSYRRRRKLNKYFKAKNEMSMEEDSQEF